MNFLRRHDVALVNIVITGNFAMFVLHLTGYAEYRTIKPTVFTMLIENQSWSVVYLATAFWLLIFRKPPQAIWGLWVSTTTFALWGVMNFFIGLTASHPVSLLGPMLLLIFAAPVSWLSTEYMLEKEDVLEKIIDK